MDNLMPAVFILGGLILFGALISSVFTYDKLIRLEYNSYKSEWEKDGQPRGYFWLPPEYLDRKSNWLSRRKSNWAFQRNNFRWMFSTPEWIKEDTQAKKLVSQWRTLVLIWIGCLLLIFVSTVIFETTR